MRYWWVNQNQTFQQEIAGGYLWSPKRNANGARNPFYESMREVSPGDVVFSFVDTRITAIGFAQSYCWECPKPPEFGLIGQNWENIGWRVNVAFSSLLNKVRPKDHIEVLRRVLPRRYSPLQQNGNGVQSIYLTELPADFAEVLAAAAPIKALSWREVTQITKRFDSLSPYNRNTVPHLLRLTDENYDKNDAQRQLFGLSIAAKRYALFTTKCGKAYCTHRNCIGIVDPKAHGLIFFAPNDERKDGLPTWWWDLWRFLLRLEFKQIKEPDFNVLMVAGRAINTATATEVDGQPMWVSLPAMMKMRISTPHYLDQMKGKASAFGFVLHPRTRETLKLTLLTPFSKNRARWALSSCINTRDGKSYRLNEFSQADIITLGDILCGYIQHAEIKSLGPDGEKCKAHTRGLLRRMTIHGGLQHCIGKEVSRFEQGKDDFIENIDDECIHYDGGRVTANDSLIAEIKTRGLRKTTKQTKLDRKTIRAVLNGEKVKASTLAKVVAGLRAGRV